MLHVELELLAGRFHATPPERQPNEREVEWPPHPWRIQRALLAVGFRTLGWKEAPATARSLSEGLAENPPSFRLPRAPTPSARSAYVPVGGGRRLLKDAFLSFVPGERVGLRWPVELPAAESELLDALLEGWTWLGRSESWISAKRTAGFRPGPWMSPASDPVPPAGHVGIRLRAPETARGFRRALAAASEVVLREAHQNARNAARDRARLRARYPSSVFDALLMSSEQWLADQWSHPPGCRWLDYDMPRGHLPAPALGPPPLRSGGGKLPPSTLFLPVQGQPASRALTLAEHLHARLAASLGAGDVEAREQLLGLDPQGRPARGHRHLHLVPWIRGFRAVGVLAWLPRGWTPRTREIAEAAWGALEEAPPSARLTAPSRQWRSVSPWLAPRHPRRGRDRPEDQIRRELRDRGWPKPSAVRMWSPGEVRGAGFYACVRRRSPPREGPAWNRPFGCDLTFEGPVEGPLALGYAAHFGLGAFAGTGVAQN